MYQYQRPVVGLWKMRSGPGWKFSSGRSGTALGLGWANASDWIGMNAARRMPRMQIVNVCRMAMDFISSRDLN